jgi:hypothetical protein
VRRWFVPAALAVAVSAEANAAPARDALIRPGVGIGKVRVGMTFAQARLGLGPRPVLVRQRRYGFGSRYAEYAWRGSEWTVGVVGRGGRARVVSVATQARRERTSGGIGVGSSEHAVRRALGARCFGKERQFDPITGERVFVPALGGDDLMWCFLGRDRKLAHTTFSLVERCRIPAPHPMKCPAAQRVYLVFEVAVGEPRFVWGYWGD